MEFCTKVAYFRSSDQDTSYHLLFQDYFFLGSNSKEVFKMENRLIGGHTHADDDARIRSYLAEMRKEMAARLREHRWQQTQEILAKKKEYHYKKWRRDSFPDKILGPTLPKSAKLILI